MSLLLPIMSSVIQGIVLSLMYGYERELRDGMSTSRFFPWLTQWMGLNIVTAPLFTLFPQATVTLNLIYYTSLTLISVFNYAFSVFHKIQIAKNSGKEPNVTLPFDLHNNEFFKALVSTLTPKIFLGLGTIYALSLGLMLAISGAYLSVACILGAMLLDQGYQWEWFPSFLHQPYQLLRLALFSSWVFGFDSWISIGLTTFNLSIFLWNFITMRLRGERSPTCQFKIAQADHEFSFEKTLDGVRPKTSSQLEQVLTQLSPSLNVRVTYNHFRGSELATRKLTANAPELDNADYLRLFTHLDFNKPELREIIVNQMAVHDKFHEKSLEERRAELNLPQDCEDADLYIAFLHKEMEHLVDRLNHPYSSRSISHEQRILLMGQARRVLEHLQLHGDDVALHERILLDLALRTGSHCSRVYLETFAEICNSLNFETADLSLKERAALMAQALRNEQYRRYYYYVMKRLYGYLDPNDYHSYENFVSYYGSFYYLQNQSLQNRYPDGFDLLTDRGFYYFLKYLRQPVFSEYYNEKTLLDSVLRGELHPLFRQWCEEFYEGAYAEWVLDPETLSLLDDAQVIELAKLMLLDLGLVELSQPLDKDLIERMKPNSHRGPLQTILDARNQVSPGNDGLAVAFAKRKPNEQLLKEKQEDELEDQFGPTPSYT